MSYFCGYRTNTATCNRRVVESGQPCWQHSPDCKQKFMRDMSPSELANVVLSRTIKSPDGCLLWQGATSSHGYGELASGGLRFGATHRVAYEGVVGRVADGLVLDHLCRVRNCANPEHLEPVTVRENTMRGVSISAVSARKVTCVNGHSLIDESNVYHLGGTRRCRACNRQAAHELRQRRMSKAIQTRSEGDDE